MAGMYHVPKHEGGDRIQSLLKTFGLIDRSGAKFGGLSKGLKRRATIAAALLHRPALLFLDEPTSVLDVMSARFLRQFLKDLRATGVTVFFTTHYIEEADQLCDRIAIIVKGRIIAVDTPEQLKAVVKGTSIIEACAWSFDIFMLNINYYLIRVHTVHDFTTIASSASARFLEGDYKWLRKLASLDVIPIVKTVLDSTAFLHYETRRVNSKTMMKLN
jgi:ABC-type multidrug transport system ATPase subunit